MIIEANIYLFSNIEKIRMGFHADMEIEDTKVKCDVQFLDKDELKPGNWAHARVTVDEYPESFYFTIYPNKEFILRDDERSMAYGCMEKVYDF